MKNLYFIAAALFCTTLSAQNTISFETSEGYIIGNVEAQNGWEVTRNSDEQPIANQTITNENAFTGTQSLKIAVDEAEDFGFFPIFGATKQFSQPINYLNAKIEFDIFISELDGSTFEFGTWGINGDEFMPISVFSFNYTSNLEIVTTPDYDYTSPGFTWEANKWYKLKAEIFANEIKYYIDGNLIYTGTNYSKTNIEGINFVHDSFSGHAYIDNIVINNEALSVNNSVKGNVALFPNPVKNNLNFSLPNAEKIANVSIHNITGQKVISKEISQNTINVENLKAGVYIVTITNNKGISYTSKFIKE